VGEDGAAAARSPATEQEVTSERIRPVASGPRDAPAADGAHAAVEAAIGEAGRAPGDLPLERTQKLFGVFIAGRRGGANGTKRGNDLLLHGTLSVGQNAPCIRIGCGFPKLGIEPTEPVDRVGELIELPSHIHLQSAVR
jgi:hypothetical protein